MNHDQKNAILVVALVTILGMGLFWYVDRQNTDQRVAKRIRGQIEATVEHENTYTLDYARAFFTNQLMLDVENDSDRGFVEISEEQLFWNVFRMWNLRVTRHWNRTNFDAERVVVDALDLLEIETAEEFATRFRNTRTYRNNSELFDDSKHLANIKILVGDVLRSSGRGNMRNSDLER
jgi:hypothetical protein